MRHAKPFDGILLDLLHTTRPRLNVATFQGTPVELGDLVARADVGGDGRQRVDVGDDERGCVLGEERGEQEREQEDAHESEDRGDKVVERARSEHLELVVVGELKELGGEVGECARVDGHEEDAEAVEADALCGGCEGVAELVEDGGEEDGEEEGEEVRGGEVDAGDDGGHDAEIRDGRGRRGGG